MVVSLSELVSLFPITDEVMEKVESVKNDYYRSQLSSPDVLPFMSFDSNCFLSSTYPHGTQLTIFVTCIAATGLYEYASFFQSHSDVLLYYNPTFDRPTLSFPPSREDFTFLPSTSPSDSFLYLPICKEEARTPVKFQEDCKNLWSASMSKPTIDKVRNLIWFA